MGFGVSVRVSCEQVGSRDSSGAWGKLGMVLPQLPEGSCVAGGNALREGAIYTELSGIYIRYIEIPLTVSQVISRTPQV